jgi:tetratricopeptide (TPR) repeat protein
LAVKLLQRELEETPAGAEAWEALVVGLVRALLAVGDHPEAVRQASRALTVMADPARRGETSWMLAHAQVSAGHSREDAISTIRQAVGAAGLPRVWQARLLAFLALLDRGISSVDATNSIARQALTAAKEAGDPSATAQALTDLWLTYSVARDHATALDCIDRALQVVGDDRGHDRPGRQGRRAATRRLGIFRINQPLHPAGRRRHPAAFLLYSRRGPRTAP